LLVVVLKRKLNFLRLLRGGRLLSRGVGSSLLLRLILAFLNCGFRRIAPTSDGRRGVLIHDAVLYSIAPIALAGTTLLRWRIARELSSRLAVEVTSSLGRLVAMRLGVNRTTSATITGTARSRATLITLRGITTRGTFLGRLRGFGLFGFTKLSLFSRSHCPGGWRGIPSGGSSTSSLLGRSFLGLRSTCWHGRLGSIIGKQREEVLGRIVTGDLSGHLLRQAVVSP